MYVLLISFAYVKTEFERPLLLEQLKDLQTLRLRIVCQHESFAQDVQLMDLCVSCDSIPTSQNIHIQKQITVNQIFSFRLLP